MEDLLDTAEAIEQIEKFKGVNVTGIRIGSLVFYLQCTDLGGLGELWFMYKNGKLNDLLVSSLISEETLQQLCAESISVKTTINIEDFRKALVYLFTTPTAEGQPKPRLPQEYPLYQPHIHNRSNVLDVLHLDNLKHDLQIPSSTQTEDSQDGLEINLGNQQAAGDHHDANSEDVQVEQVTSQLASLDTFWQSDEDTGKIRSGSIRSTSSIGSATSLLSTRTSSGVSAKDEQVREVTSKRRSVLDIIKWPNKFQIKQKPRSGSITSTASIRSAATVQSKTTIQSSDSGQSRVTSRSSDTGYASAGSLLTEEDKESFAVGGNKDPKDILKSLHEQLNTPAVKKDKALQLDLYCQIGDLYRTRLHDLQSALTYYQNMLKCAQALSKDTQQAMAYCRLGMTYDILGKQKQAFKNHERALHIYKVTLERGADICIAYKNLASSLTLSNQVSDAKSNYETALAVAMETENKTEQMEIYWKLGDLHRKQLHEPQVSHKYYTEMLALARDLGRKDRERLAYNRLGVACWDMQDYEAALEWIQMDLKMCQESGDKTEQITAYQNIADSYKALGKLDLARSHNQSAIDIAMETGNKTEQMNIYWKLGDLHRKQLHEPQVSHKYYTEMLALARDLGRKDKERQAYNRLGLACEDMQDYEAALQWHQMDLKNRQESEDKTNQTTAHENIAASYKALGKLDLARSHYQSAMDIAVETGNKTEQMDIYWKLGDLHRKQLHEPQVSHKYYTEMLALVRDLGRKDRERQAYNRLGLACGDMQDYETALKWHQMNLKMTQESGDKTEQITAHKNIAASYKELGKLDLARSHYQSAMTIAMETGDKHQQNNIAIKLANL
ncbi:tetratricopeptide repeat protein 28-like [Branchiostoma floridae]|uniref:Tetratricopeptide repeat protein 28-like n=1 Tax=Branchiostoma floridae TaxID=7739 RepID=A0A9J7KKH8_BRAFL|nr:tetratricopeptide repeat protein 28-like [Branchiostoma floridae]